MLGRKPDISPAEHKEHMYEQNLEYLHTHTNVDEAAVSSEDERSSSVEQRVSPSMGKHNFRKNKMLCCFVCVHPKKRTLRKSSKDGERSTAKTENMMFYTHYTSPPHIDRLLLLLCAFIFLFSVFKLWRKIFRGKNFMKRENKRKKRKDI